MAFTIIVDGPNFINQLQRLGKDKEYILNKFSFPSFQALIQQKLHDNGLAGTPFLRTEFICSNKRRIGDFKDSERDELINKLKYERGVTVVEVQLSSNKADEPEKGVDITVFSRMLEMSDGGPWKHVVLVSADRDFVPALESLRKKGIHTILVGLKTQNSLIELANESYLFLDLEQLLFEMESTSSPTEPV